MENALSRHERIALQFSGGKDSLACLYLMREHLDRITVYWLNTGAAFPETVQTVERVRELAPNFVEIDGGQPAVVREFGIPSDIVPASATPMGVSATGGELLIQDRYSCCLRTMMMPLHERMVADGVTLIIRGQRSDDAQKAPIRSGHVENGVEYLFPIEDWTARQVMDFLREQNAPIPRFYEVLDEAPDCMTCSAWWEKGASKYLKRYHYHEFIVVQERLDAISRAMAKHISDFNKEVSL